MKENEWAESFKGGAPRSIPEIEWRSDHGLQRPCPIRNGRGACQRTGCLRRYILIGKKGREESGPLREAVSLSEDKEAGVHWDGHGDRHGEIRPGTWR